MKPGYIVPILLASGIVFWGDVSEAQSSSPPSPMGSSPSPGGATDGSGGGGGGATGAPQTAPQTAPATAPQPAPTESSNLKNDVADKAGASAQAQEILRNSVNLTKVNAYCSEILANNLQNNTDLRSTQPVIPLKLEMKFILISLNDINDASGIVSMTARVDFTWNDTRLALADNVTCAGKSLLVKTESLWFPYFIVQNGAKNVFYPDAWEKYPSSLSAEGQVYWKVAFKFDLSCSMDFTIFPFDTQTCKMLIQSPHFSTGELNYTVTNESRAVVMFDEDSANHPMWVITGQAVKYTTRVPGIVFYIQFKRKAMYHVLTIAIPVMAVCILTASTFVVPAEGEEKLSTVINALLSFFLLYLLFITAIPQTSTNIPQLMTFFSVQILLTTAATIMCAVILRLLGIEEAEEEMEEREEHDIILKSQSAARRPMNGLAATEEKSMSPYLYGHHRANKIGPLNEEAELETQPESNQPKQEPKKEESKKKKRCITASKLNEITLGVYIFSVIISIIGFVGAMVQIYRNAKSTIAVTPVEEYSSNDW